MKASEKFLEGIFDGNPFYRDGDQLRAKIDTIAVTPDGDGVTAIQFMLDGKAIFEQKLIGFTTSNQIFISIDGSVPVNIVPA